MPYVGRVAREGRRPVNRREPDFGVVGMDNRSLMIPDGGNGRPSHEGGERIGVNRDNQNVAGAAQYLKSKSAAARSSIHDPLR